MKGKKIKLEGIILSSYPYGENHKIFHIFSPKEGIVSAIAHGARKYQSRFRGKIETLNWIEGLFNQSGKSSMLVVEETRIKENLAAHLPYDALWTLLPFLKFLALFHFSEVGENHKIFSMFAAFLKALSVAKNLMQVRLLCYSFALKSLIATSMIPNIRYCCHCGRKNRTPVFFNPREGKIGCRECFGGRENFRTLTPFFYSFLIKIIYFKFDEIIYFITQKETLENCRDFLDAFLLHYLGKRWKDFEADENPFDPQPEIGEKPSLERQASN